MNWTISIKPLSNQNKHSGKLKTKLAATHARSFHTVADTNEGASTDATAVATAVSAEPTRKASSTATFLQTARKVLDAEAQAVASLKSNLDDQFSDACQRLLDCSGRVVVTGVGKSGHIANKIAATLASTGTPAFFVHPAEASHGDLGMITKEDVVIAMSYGGESDELKTILPVIKRLKVPLIALTGQPTSSLAKAADAVLNVSVSQEACSLGLVPTNSTTATLAMGDALAVAVLEARGFSADEFARTHPGGKLGKKLLLKVKDIMVCDNTLPTVISGTLLKDSLFSMSAGQLGFLAVVDQHSKLLGVFSDGDLRRALDHNTDITTTCIDDVMTTGGYAVNEEQLAADALLIMEQRRIYALPVLDNHNRVCGALNMHTLLHAGIV